jgi:hypothetical protein
MGLIDEKNRGLKISCYCPFKEKKFAKDSCLIENKKQGAKIS